MNSPRRSTRWSDTEVQGSLLRRLVVHWIVFIGINGLALTLWSYRLDFPNTPLREFIGIWFLRFLPAILFTPPLLAFFLWDATRISNRFTGPIKRLQKALRSAAQGREVSAIKFRKNDYWQELAVHFNAIFASRKETR